MCSDLWQAVCHGEQGRTKTRSQEAAQEETAEACRESGGDADRLQTNRAQALIACFSPAQEWNAHLPER